MTPRQRAAHGAHGADHAGRTGNGPAAAHPASRQLPERAPTEQLTVPRDNQPVLEVLPFGAGLACLGLGLGIVGLRMRQR